MNDALPILLFGGPVEFAFSVANSWKPVGQKAKITQSAGREVKTIGELKALDFYRHYLGEHADPAKEFPLAVYEPGQERFYLRVPIHYDDRTGTISFSEAIPVGATVQRDAFQELKGGGVALGLDESFEYEENSVTGVGGGQIIAIGTDGIWEAHNKHGEMFGKARFRDALRRRPESRLFEIIG